MELSKILEKKNISQYRLSKESGIAQATISEICNHKADIKKCNVDTVYHIAKALNISMESLIEKNKEVS